MCSICIVCGVLIVYLCFFYLLLIMCGVIILVMIILVFFFMFFEDWSYFEVLYFCFIFLIIIGFGDFVFGDDLKWWRSEYCLFYKVCCVFFFIIGFIFLFFILEFCVKILDDYFGMFFFCYKLFF